MMINKVWLFQTEIRDAETGKLIERLLMPTKNYSSGGVDLTAVETSMRDKWLRRNPEYAGNDVIAVCSVFESDSIADWKEV